MLQVAQTRIQFNEKQLLQLIHQHLLSKNLSETASALQKEAGLPPLPVKQASTVFPPYRTSSSSVGSTPTTPSRTSRINTQGALALAGTSTPVTPVPSTSASTPSVQIGQPMKLNLSTRLEYLTYLVYEKNVGMIRFFSFKC